MDASRTRTQFSSRVPFGRHPLRGLGPETLIPGVANKDARRVYDARVASIFRDKGIHPQDPRALRAVAQGLADSIRLRLWRARRIMGFEAFVEEVLELSLPEARTLVQHFAEQTSTAIENCSEETVALWMRTEAALLEAGIDGQVELRVVDGKENILLNLPTDRAAQALHTIGRRMFPLLDDMERALPPHRNR